MDKNKQIDPAESAIENQKKILMYVLAILVPDKF